MTSPADLALTRAFLRETGRLRITGASTLLRIWRNLPGYDEKDVARYERQALPFLEALQAATAAITGGYLSRIAETDPPDISDLEIAQDPRHPFIGVWKALAAGVAFSDAVKVGETRSEGLAKERISVTQRFAARRAKNVVGWRRIPRGVTCSWCVHVATGRYHSAESASFGHGHKGVDYCDCEVVPIVGKSDPGRVINHDLLDRWKQAQTGDTPPAYFNVNESNFSTAARP